MRKTKKFEVTMALKRSDLIERRWNLFVRAMQLALRDLGVKDVWVNSAAEPPGPGNWEFRVMATPKCPELVVMDERRGRR